MNTKLILGLVAVCFSTVFSQVSEWNQCGGIGYNGLTQCAPGLECFANTDWWSACLKKCPEGWRCQTEKTTKPPVTITASNGGGIGMWGTCGGEGYSGPTQCAPGLQCYARSKWYSMCRDKCPKGEDWDCEKNIYYTTTSIPLTTTEESTTGESNTGESTTGESTTGESTTGESTTGESTTGDSATEESTTGESTTAI